MHLKHEDEGHPLVEGGVRGAGGQRLVRNAHARRGRGGVVRVVEAARAGVDVLVVHQLSVH